MNTILEAQHITKHYRNGRGIDDLSLALYRGEVFGLVGPNGVGKTTFLKSICGLIRTETGEVSINGHSLSNHYEAAMSTMGCLIEAPALYESLTAQRNLLMHARFYPNLEIEQSIDTALNSVGLSYAKHEKVRGFSQGMKQRLGIASALLSNPELVILDEPTNGLDVESILQFKDLIRTLSLESNRTFLISSHQMFDLESICDRIGILYDGKLVKTEHTEHILKNYKTLEQWYVEHITRLKGGIKNE